MPSNFSRRRFLKTSLLASASLPFAGRRRLLPPASLPEHIGLQLYSLRDDMARDPAATIRAVSKIGYREVEAYNYNTGQLFGFPYAEFDKILQDNGLVMHSTHAGISLADYVEKTGDISDAVKKWVDAAPALGLRYLISPSISEADRPQIGKVAKMFQAMGRYCQKAGLRFAHHNHDYEFAQRGPDNRLLIEWLLHEVDPSLLAFQMDLYWVVFAKNNPLDWFRLYPGRWELCHAKDLAPTEKRETAVIGEGAIDFKSIFQKSQEAGLKYYVVELEHYTTTPLEGVEKSRAGLLGLF